MIDLPPEEFRKLGYQAVDLIADQLANLRERPVRQPVPDEVREAFLNQDFGSPMAEPEALLAHLAETLLPYPMGNNSPRFFAWVNPPAAPMGVLADMLASYHNPSVTGGDLPSIYIEHGVMRWVKSVFGFPEDSYALITSGGSVANLLGLAVMRYVKTGGEIRQNGYYNQNAPLVVYSTGQGHSCIQKAIELLGIGSNYLRKIPTDAELRMDTRALQTQIALDRAAGLLPICVAASAGTVNTGAIDPLEEIADICAAEDLWLHVDGAYGGFGILGEQTQGMYKGIERADSIAVDPHKWLSVPVECGCALVRDAVAMRATFSLVPPYLQDEAVIPWISEFSIQQTRGFKALKLWMVLSQIGESGYRELITQNISLSRCLCDKIRARSDFELVASGPLSAACFVYSPPGVEDLRNLNKALLELVQLEGQIFTTGTEVGDRYVIRTCIVNFRTTEEDLDFLLDTLAEAGQRVLAGA